MAETHPGGGGGAIKGVGGWVCGVEATLKTLTPSVKELKGGLETEGVAGTATFKN